MEERERTAAEKIEEWERITAAADALISDNWSWHDSMEWQVVRDILMREYGDECWAARTETKTEEPSEVARNFLNSSAWDTFTAAEFYGKAPDGTVRISKSEAIRLFNDNQELRRELRDLRELNHDA